MANKSIFTSNKAMKTADILNEAGGSAYKLSSEEAMAQIAMTGTINYTFYSSAEEQLDTLINLCKECRSEFIAKLAVYASREGFMKDMPAILCAYLSTIDIELFKKVFDKIMHNGKMVRNFVQIMRSGKLGRKSLGSAPKKKIQEWIKSRPAEKLFFDTVGNSPSMADLIKMTHPKPIDKKQENLFGYILGKEVNKKYLPEIVRKYENYKNNPNAEVPDVPFQMLTSLNLGKKEWTEIALNTNWNTTRMNINTFNRHGVFDNNKIIDKIVNKLTNKDDINKSKCFPYALWGTYCAIKDNAPIQIKYAIQDAIDVMADNMPSFTDKKVHIFVDNSGSMNSPVTGYRAGGTSSISCSEVAMFFASIMFKHNINTELIVFNDKSYLCKLNHKDSIVTNIEQMKKVPSGGTNCSSPLSAINKLSKGGDLIIYLSDNESWVNSNGLGKNTGVYNEWKKFKTNNKNAKMVCIDLQPNTTTQIRNSNDIMNIGGFSDKIFDVIKNFVENKSDKNYWTNLINKVNI